MANKVDMRAIPTVAVDKRWVSEPAIVLLGYLLLGLLMMLTSGSLLRAGLATILALLGSGYSLVAVLLPRQTEFDVVERAALAACLSLAVGGMLGVLLARSTWGLRLIPFLTTTGLFNLGCYVIVWYRRRGWAGDERPFWSWSLDTLLGWWTGQSLPSQLVTVGLIALLISGAWAFNRALLRPSSDPPMTEFFLLGQSGLAEDYPETALAGEPLAITYGIANREKEAGLYQVRALANGEMVGRSQPIRLSPGEIQDAQIELRLPEQAVGPTKVEIILYREDKRYRSLHLWLEVEKAKPSPLSTSRSAVSLAQ